MSDTTAPLKHYSAITFEDDFHCIAPNEAEAERIVLEMIKAQIDRGVFPVVVWEDSIEIVNDLHPTHQQFA